MSGSCAGKGSTMIRLTMKRGVLILMCAALSFGGSACSSEKKSDDKTEQKQKKSDGKKRSSKDKKKSDKSRSGGVPKVEADFEEMVAKTINEDNYEQVLDNLDEQIRIEQETALGLFDKLEAEAKSKKKSKDEDAKSKDDGKKKAEKKKKADVKKSALKPAGAEKAPKPPAE